MRVTTKISLAATLLFCVVVTACGGGSGASISNTQLPPSAPTLSSISISPSAPSVAAGNSQQLTATGHYSDSTTKDMTSSATWKSSDTTIATVSSTGLATSLKQGTVTLTATSGSVSGTVSLAVSAPALASISITPTGPNLGKGQNQKLTVNGVYTDKSTQDVTAQATWQSSDATIAAVDATGMVAACAVGQASISATVGQLNASVSVTVGPPILTTVSVVPGNASVAIGQTQQFTAFGIWSDNSTTDLTKQATWASSDKSIASVDSDGLAKGVAMGSAVISATSGNISGNTSLGVTAAVLQSIDITPDSPLVPAGGAVQFTATGTFSDGSTQDLADVTWTSSDDSVAKINSDGLATGVAADADPVTIGASVGAISDSTTLQVGPATLISVDISPDDSSIAKGTTQQFTATGTFTDGSTQDLTAAVTWTSSSNAVAAIDATGLATGVHTGSVTITASAGSVPDVTTTLTVTPATVSSITVTPALAVVGIGGTQQFTASGTFSDGSVQDVTALVTWTSSSATVATITSAGLANAVSVGTAAITASFGGISGSTSFTVTSSALQSIIINNIPTRSDQVSSLKMGKKTRMQLYAWGVFNDGSTRLLSSVVWSSSNGRAVSVGSTGSARTKNHTGTALIKATLNGVVGSVSITVANTTIQSITVQPADPNLPSSPSIAAGTSLQFVAIATYGDGSTQNLGSSAYWQTSNAALATVSAGLVHSLKAGSVSIKASYGGMTGSTTLTITGAQLQSITVTPSGSSIPLGAAQQFTATGTFSDGTNQTTQDLTRFVTWSSSQIGVAVIDRYGVAVSAGRGTTNIGAAFRNLNGTTVNGTTALNVN